MVPYFFISVFIITTKLLVGGANEYPVSLTSFYKMFYYPAAAPFVWFVYVLFMIFLIVPHSNTRKGLPVLFAIALVLHFVPLHLPDAFLYLLEFKRMLVFFVAGCLFSEWRNVRTVVMKTHFLVFVAFYILCYVCKDLLTNNFMDSLFGFMVSLFGATLIIKTAQFISQKGKIQQVFLSVAACSYTIYLFHTTFMGVAKALCGKLHLEQYTGDTVSFIIEAFLVISTGIIGSMLLHHLITRKSKILSYLTGAKFVNKRIFSKNDSVKA